MAKRKRQTVAVSEAAPEPMPTKKTKASDAAPKQKPTKTKPKTTTTTTTTTTKTPTPTNDKPSLITGPAVPETIQIVAGSYDRVLHGFTASISTTGELDFADTFLFNAHASAIRCVAISPPTAPLPNQTQKVLLASGSTDERIQVYNLSAHPPSRRNQKLTASVAPRPILENAKNRELGTLLHHESTVNALHFPTRSKLLSASDDSSVAVTRTRDWAMLSAIRAPKAKAQGRPSGDTAVFGGAPSGVNDFAVHPSMKLMISVSKGERCMRLWNLVTGKKAGVLSFGREMLQELGEGRYATGEARRVVWGSADGADEFAVGFDKGLVVFGMDSVPKCRVLGGAGAKAKGKIHQFGYLTLDEAAGLTVLGVATEDGRIAFYSTRSEDITSPTPEAQGEKEEEKREKTTTKTAGKGEEGEEEEDGAEKDKKANKQEEPASLPVAKFVGQVGGRADGVSSRIKDFALMKSTASPDLVYAVGASSDSRVRIWLLSVEDLRRRILAKEPAGEETMGKLAGTYETHNRITCMAGYLMIPRPDGVEDSEDEDEEDEEESDQEEDSESDAA
ncbi:Protein MAK11 [Escovopsis weberi]|uniref:Protein MAK11 n=1 Tax=Escovopsis weberi TaxID=150374 RepID=A0A0M9VTF5_ESCWE|nr:Protein MAK11 [Escovopsis weberi]